MRLLLPLALALAACGGSHTGPNESILEFEGDPPRHLLMISLDTTRRDHIGRYRDQPTLTPFLDARMDEAFIVDDFTSCSNWTFASTVCVLSGATDVERAADRGMIPLYALEDPPPLPDGVPMLPRWLGDAGFKTAFVTANGFFGPTTNAAQGFDRLSTTQTQGALEVWDIAQDLVHRTARNRYLHLHFMEPHMLYTPPQEYLGELDALPEVPYDFTTRKGNNEIAAVMNADPPVLTPEQLANLKEHYRVRYRGEMMWFDDQLKTIWRDLDDQGLLDETLVVFWTDHGEAFWENGMRGHARHLFRPENDGAAFFWARNLKPGVHTEPVSGIDLTPTVLQVFGLDRPPEVTGHALGEAGPDRVRHAFANTLEGPVHSARKGDRKLIYLWRSGALFAYDLATDPLESDNLAADGLPAEFEDLWQAMLPRIELARPAVADDPRNWDQVWPLGLEP